MSSFGKRSSSSKDSSSTEGREHAATFTSINKRQRTRDPHRHFSAAIAAIDDDNNSSSSGGQPASDDQRSSDNNQQHYKRHSTTVGVAGSDARHRSPSLGMAKLLFGTNIEKVHIDTVRASNAKADQLKDIVAVFVGGTSGIGEATAKELFRRTTSPKAYIVGRNVTRGNEIVKQLHQLNPRGEAIFLEKDCSFIKNVDEVCHDIKQRERKVNCLVLTAGYLTMKGRTETIEGLDRKMAMNYYCRMRWILNLMPLLTAAAQLDELSRALTILAAGSENEIKPHDLDLKHNFTLNLCMAHCVLMTDFMIEELAKHYPSTSFSHSFPGTVKTGIANELTAPVRLAVKVMYALMSPWIMNLQESGERHLFQMTSKCYPPNNRAAGVEVPPDMHVMRGSNGRTGTGAYLLDWDGKATGEVKILEKYRALDFGKTVWEHTMAMFKQAEERNPSNLSGSSMFEGQKDVVMSGNDNLNPVGWRAA